MPLEEGRMHRFVADLLAEDGALVEPLEPGGLEVLAPPKLQQALGVAEFCRFGFGPTFPEGAQRVGIESDWLARFERVIGERGRWSRRVLDPGTRKVPDAERLLEKELGLENATYRLLDAAPAWTRYLVLEFRFTALSDEKRAGTQRLAINLATGAMPDVLPDRMARFLAGDGGLVSDAGLVRVWGPVRDRGLVRDGGSADGAADNGDSALPEDAALPRDWDRARVIDRVRSALPARVEAALAPFVAGLRRRLDRDLDRLHAYHNDLHREASRRAAQLAAGDAGRQREDLRIAAIAQDYRAKLDDLAHKYALRVTVDWVQTLDLVMPVHRLTVQIRRRKAERVMALDWNPLARRLEMPPCEASWSTERPRLVCDEALHLVAPAGLAPCAGCGRTYCHACHRQRCPKCGHAGAVSAFLEVATRSDNDAPAPSAPVVRRRRSTPATAAVTTP
jgi:hypothetical protein